jgi:predicted RNase H-like HicB family nuclease
MSTFGKSRKESKAIDRPFDPAILSEARRIAAHYRMMIWSENKKYYGRGVELPLVMSGGKTADECVQNTQEALEVAVAVMLEEGEKPPAPASDETRSVQLNIRLTASEKSLLEQAAQRNGFRGVSDYVRHTALAHGDN